jgi:predicted secreted protein
MKKCLLIMLCVLISSTSCKKYLEATPTDFVSPDAYYTSLTQLQAALNSVYNAYQSSLTFGLDYSYSMTFATDEGQLRTGYATAQIGTYQYASNETNVTSFWQECYVGIERANLLLANINKPTLTAAQEPSRGTIKGEALFLRSYLYFLLVTNFGDVPLILAPTSSVLNTAVARTPTKDVYAQIIADMTTAEGLLQTQTLTVTGTPEKVTVTAVEGILARVCLHAAGFPNNDKTKYADALTWATKAINSGQQALNADYTQVWKNIVGDKYDLKESMWEIGFYIDPNNVTSSAGFIGNYFGPASPAGSFYGNCYGLVTSTTKVFDLYGVDAASMVSPQKNSFDLRRDWNCAQFQYAADGSKTISTSADKYTYWQGKFRREFESAATGSTRQKNQSGENWPMLRYSDVLLMQAEADNEVHNGATSVGISALNQVRRRAWGILYGNVLNTVTITNAGSGYTVAPVIAFTGGSGSGATATSIIASGKVTAVNIQTRGALVSGSYYSAAPAVSIGTAWASGTAYTVGQQVYNGNNLYTVSTAGTSTVTPPIQASGASTAATTGAVFTYAGVKATATATISTETEADYTGALDHDSFLKYIQDERSRELCYEGLRKLDLIRWGIFYTTMKGLNSGCCQFKRWARLCFLRGT